MPAKMQASVGFNDTSGAHEDDPGPATMAVSGLVNHYDRQVVLAGNQKLHIGLISHVRLHLGSLRKVGSQ